MKQTLTIILLIASIAATAQVSLIGGLHYSNLIGKPESDKKPKFGPRVGVLIATKHLQLQTLYASKGVMENRNIDPATGEFARDRWSFNLNYLTQTASISIGSGWFTGQLGAYGSYLINSRQSNTFWPAQPYYASDLFRRWDLGPVAGVSVDLHGASLHLSYERGLRAINPPGYVHEGFKNEAGAISISVPITGKL